MIEQFTTPTNPTEARMIEQVRRDAVRKIFEYETTEHYIDEGGAATVYDLPGGFCVKIMHDHHRSANRHLKDLGNPVGTEARLQERISKLQWDGKTRVPKYLGVLVAEEGNAKNAIIMEHLNAVNLQHVLSGDAALPDNFDLHAFFDDLEGFVQTMHEQGGVAHKDLFPRNVMVDSTTGEPRIIDFGRSVLLESLTPEEQKKAMDDDWQKLDELCTALDTLQKKKNIV